MDFEPCRIRAMTLEDLGVVLDLEESLQSHPWRHGHFENCLAIGNLALVVEDGDRQIVAFAVVSVGGGEGELLNIGVKSDCQAKGLATCFLSEIIQQVSALATSLFLEVRESNDRAIGLYHKLGFNQVGVRPNYYPAKKSREDALIFAVDLECHQTN